MHLALPGFASVDRTQPKLREELLTVEEVAKWLKVNPQTVRNWVDRGALGALHVGPRRVRIRQSELERFLAAGETHAAATGPDWWGRGTRRARRGPDRHPASDASQGSHQPGICAEDPGVSSREVGHRTRGLAFTGGWRFS